jgi:Mg-chelatase subunit ChlD
MFLRELRPAGKMQLMDRLIRDYLHQLEAQRGWDHVAVQHSGVLRSLYAYARVKPTNDRVRVVLFGQIEKHGPKLPPPKGSVFEAVANLKKMSPSEAAGAILRFKIPFLIAAGALEEKAKEPELVQALISQMSATELTTNMKMLEKLGVKTNPALRGALDAALAKAATSKKNTLKTTAAVDAVEDETLKEKLRSVQKKQIAAAGGPEGNWLVLADKSGSMANAIEIARHVSASLAQFVKGKVYLVFFDSSPMTVDVTGLSLDQIQKATRHISAGGGTSIGCGLNRMLAEKIEIDGIAVVSDGGENQPPYFHDVYRKYAAFAGKDVPVYFYSTGGEANSFSGHMNSAGIEMQTFDLRGGKVDYYSIPNLVQTMRASMYSLVDEIMALPLLSLSDVLKNSEELVGV